MGILIYSKGNAIQIGMSISSQFGSEAGKAMMSVIKESCQKLC